LALSFCRRTDGCIDATVTELRQAHRAKSRRAATSATDSPQEGPGTELHKILERMGFEITDTCPCRKHIKQMNEWGPAGCREHLDEIIDWLKAEAERRNKEALFVRWGVRLVILLAIRRAEKREKRSCAGPP